MTSRISLPINRVRNTLLCLAVWSASAAGAWWLYQGGQNPQAVIATVEAKRYQLSPTQLARLVALDVAEGQPVAAGQVVARFETELLDHKISVAGTLLEQAASSIPATSLALESSTLQAERSFQSELDAIEVELNAAHHDFARTRTELQTLVDSIRREQDLVRRGLTRTDRVSALEVQRASLEETVAGWPKRIEAITLRKQAAATRLEQWRRTTHQTHEGARSSMLHPLRAKVREQQESIQLLRAQVHQSVLRSGPESYVVAAIHARPGDVVKPGDPVVTLVEARPKTMVAYVDERRASPLPAGSRVSAQRRLGDPHPIEGEVVSVAADVTLLPQRLWTSPHLPQWGRAMYIHLPEGASVEAGELLDVPLHGMSSSRTLASRADGAPQSR